MARGARQTPEGALRRWNERVERMAKQHRELEDFSRASQTLAGRLWGPFAKSQPRPQQPTQNRASTPSLAEQIYPHLKPR